MEMDGERRSMNGVSEKRRKNKEGGQVKDTNRREKTQRKREREREREVLKLERKEEHVLERLCQGLKSHRTQALHVTCEIHMKPAFLAHCSSKAKCFEHLNPLLSLP